MSYYVDLITGKTSTDDEDEDEEAPEDPGKEQDDEGNSEMQGLVSDDPPLHFAIGRVLEPKDYVKYPRDPLRWEPQRIRRPVSFIPQHYDDPFVRWGYIGKYYRARFSTLAGRLIMQIANDRGVPRDKLGYNLYKGHGPDTGKFAVDVCEFTRKNPYVYKLSEHSWHDYMVSGGAAWRNMQLIGYSKLERVGDLLIGTLGDYRGFMNKAARESFEEEAGR